MVPAPPGWGRGDSLNSPYGLAFDGGGNLFVTNYGSGTIGKFTSGGVGSAFASGLNGPTSITISAIPEPSTYAALCGLAVLGLAVWRRRAHGKELARVLPAKKVA